MIIEIKDLPDGKQIKNIKFDIEFENGKPIQSTQTVQTVQTFQTSNTGNVEPIEPIERNQSVQTSIPVVNNENRPHKEVPSEMLDIEF